MKNAVIGDAKSLYLSPVQAIYDVFGMGKTTIFGYKTNSASSSANDGNNFIHQSTLVTEQQHRRHFAFENRVHIGRIGELDDRSSPEDGALC